MDGFDREEKNIQEQFDIGEIDIAEYNRLMRDLTADYRAEAEESAQRAYDEEMGRW